jgi:hypothetical protein
MALINFSKFLVGKRLFRNPQISNIFIALISLSAILVGLQFFGLYEGMEQDVTVDDTTTVNNKKPSTPPMGPMPPMGQMGPMPPMGQMGPMPQGVSKPNIPIT